VVGIGLSEALIVLVLLVLLVGGIVVARRSR